MEFISIKKRKLQLSVSVKEKLSICIRLICLFLFAYTAYAKIVNHDRFFNGLNRVHMIRGIAGYISYAVPIVEILTSLLLIIPKTGKIGLYVFTGVMILFTLYIIGALLLEPNLPCQCGGAIEKLTWMQHIWFNVGFIFIAIWAIRINKHLSS